MRIRGVLFSLNGSWRPGGKGVTATLEKSREMFVLLGLSVDWQSGGQWRYAHPGRSRETALFRGRTQVSRGRTLSPSYWGKESTGFCIQPAFTRIFLKATGDNTRRNYEPTVSNRTVSTARFTTAPWFPSIGAAHAPGTFHRLRRCRSPLGEFNVGLLPPVTDWSDVS